MSGQQNIAIAKKLLDAIAGGQDPDAIAALFAPDLVSRSRVSISLARFSLSLWSSVDPLPFR
jgi:hypothetical protein